MAGDDPRQGQGTGQAPQAQGPPHVGRPRHTRPRTEGGRRGIPVPVVLLLVVLACAGGFLARGLWGSRIERGPVANAVALKESDLDATMATYELDGRTRKVTVREAILEAGTLEAALTPDGTYRVPSADNALAVARSAILAAEAQRQGIQVDGAAVDAYAQAQYGSADYAGIARAYGMDEEVVRALMRDAALMSALRDAVVTGSAGIAPEPPREPAEGEEVSRIADYARYIIALAGDEWSAETGTWASADGAYASALADYEVTADGASYEAALQAYHVAYQQHVAAQSAYSAEWTDYVNGLLSASGITLYTLAV